MITLGYFFMIAKTAIYVVDIVKDIKFINLFHSEILEKEKSGVTGLLQVGLSSAIGFLILSEICKMLQLYYWEGPSRAQRVISVVLSPFQLIPILIHHYERKLELKKHMLCDTSKQAGCREGALTQTRNELDYILRLKGEHRATENVLEHFVQLILSAVVLVANQLPREIRIFNLSQSEFNFSIFSSCVSLLSMVRGQINLISSRKNGQLGLTATILIAFYMLFAIFTRAGIIFCSIVATYQLIDDFESAHLMFTACTIAVALLHIFLSYLIQKRLLNGKKSNLKEALWSFLSPPLYLDWEYLYRKEDFEMPILKCWRRTRNSFLFHNLLTFIGNLALCIPLYIWNHYSYHGLTEFYDEYGDDFFDYYDNYYDYDIDNWQMQRSRFLFPLILAIVTQPILLALGFLYFKKFHPWARILQAELANSHPSSSNVESEMRPRRHSFHVNPSKMEMQEENDPLKMMKLRRRSL